MKIRKSDGSPISEPKNDTTGIHVLRVVMSNIISSCNAVIYAPASRHSKGEVAIAKARKEVAIRALESMGLREDRLGS